MTQGDEDSADTVKMQVSNMARDISLVKIVTNIPPKMGPNDGTMDSTVGMVKSRKIAGGPMTEKCSGSTILLKKTSLEL